VGGGGGVKDSERGDVSQEMPLRPGKIIVLLSYFQDCLGMFIPS
jgi:hypothetical protein